MIWIRVKVAATWWAVLQESNKWMKRKRKGSIRGMGRRRNRLLEDEEEEEQGGGTPLVKVTACFLKGFRLLRVKNRNSFQSCRKLTAITTEPEVKRKVTHLTSSGFLIPFFFLLSVLGSIFVLVMFCTFTSLSTRLFMTGPPTPSTHTNHAFRTYTHNPALLWSLSIPLTRRYCTRIFLVSFSLSWFLLCFRQCKW